MILQDDLIVTGPPKPWKPLRRGDLLLIFAFALLLRLAFFAASNDQAGTQQVMDNCFDCRLYMTMAQAVAEGTIENENGFFYFGPGYASFLALNNILFKGQVVPIIVVNIILSSLSCLLIYLLSMMLTRSYPISIVASSLAAVSYTSIVLSCIVMSDTFYFFMSLIALTIYLKALSSNRWILFIAAGILVAITILTRSVGQFWPLAMIVIAIAYRWRGKKSRFPHEFSRSGIIGRVAIAVVIPLTVMAVWMSHNYRENGVFTLAITSANGPANVAAVTLERRDGISSQTIMQGWLEDYRLGLDKPNLSLGEIYSAYQMHAREVIDSLGWEVGKTYVLLVWENLTEISYLHRVLIPDLYYILVPLEHKIIDNGLNLICFFLSLIGFVILIIRHRYRIAVILGTVYVYYASMIGFFRWQGSRYFFPGQIAWDILVAVSLVTIGGLIIYGIRALAKRLRNY